MGLDTVELVMEVEDTFNVDLPDAECAKVRTVGDLVALVLSKLPRSHGACPTAQTFYQFRRYLTTHTDLPRAAVRPSSRLRDLFPPERSRDLRSIWREHRRLPALELNPPVRCVLWWTAFPLTLAWWTATVLLMGRTSALLGPVAAALFFVLVYLVTRAASRFATELPAGYATVGDVVRHLTPTTIDESGAMRREETERRVFDEICRMIANQFGVRRADLRAETEFVKDLGA